MDSTTNTSTKNYGVIYGFINAGASIVFGLLLYLGGSKWFIHPVAYIAFVISITCAVLGGLAQKKADGGFLDFGKALKTVFTIFVIGSFLQSMFNYVLLNYIDVPFRESLAQQTAEATQKLMTKFGASQDVIDKTVEETLNGNAYSFKKILLGFAFGSIILFLFSLIIAAIIKKKKPEFS